MAAFVFSTPKLLIRRTVSACPAFPFHLAEGRTPPCPSKRSRGLRMTNSHAHQPSPSQQAIAGAENSPSHSGGQARVIFEGTDEHAQFASAVRGEWTGYEADMDHETGAAKVVANYYIPEEFTEWGMLPRGFECTHSVILRGPILYQKHFRVLPTVSHFGDHVDLEQTLTKYELQDAENHSTFLVHPESGSYSAGPTQVLVEKTSTLQQWPKAHLVLRHKGEAVHVYVKFDFVTAELVEPVRVVKEKYTCIYCDGADIAASSGYVSGWVEEDAVEPTALSGEWLVQVEDQVRTESRPEGGPTPTPRKQLYMPSGIDVGVQRAGDGGIVVQCGWLHTPDLRLVMRREFAVNGTVRGSSVAVESRK